MQEKLRGYLQKNPDPRENAFGLRILQLKLSETIGTVIHKSIDMWAPGDVWSMAACLSKLNGIPRLVSFDSG